MSTPIEVLMNQSMTNLKQLVDVNSIIGESIVTPDGTTVIPVSKVSFGFAAGGSEYVTKVSADKSDKPMFGGGCGGGVSMKPVAFLVIKNDTIRLLPAEASASTTDRIIDMIPDLLNKFNSFIKDFRAKGDEGEDCQKQE